MDETAAAIARLREESKPGNSAETARAASESPKNRINHAPAGAGNRKSAQVAPASTTRRQKSGGA